MLAEVLGVTADPVKARHATVPGVDRVAVEVAVLTVERGEARRERDALR
ncbi:hypothetical protein LUW76_23775 [Actinomadura madurae]|nr:hypothetical protein [Actinomadura madurae]URM97126.1 hypothetical protein LUW76_23775 [Actinomadura madurae]URN07889.1 hypothetical protein LUW74_34025 [Actinomadura madurae]